jgi:hypothetical protein
MFNEQAQTRDLTNSLFTTRPNLAPLQALEEASLLLGSIHTICTELAHEGHPKDRPLLWASVRLIQLSQTLLDGAMGRMMEPVPDEN